jgi:hypothetical protein
VTAPQQHHSGPQAQPSRFGWLVTNFAERVPGVAHAIVVSADGCCSPAPTACRGTGPTSSPPWRPAWSA